VRARTVPRLEHARGARRPLEATARRDRALLLRLQGPRAEEGEGGRLVRARGCAEGDRRGTQALQRRRRREGVRVKTARNIAIIALLAAAVVVLPGGGPAVNVLLTVIGIAFFAAIALLAYRLYMENRFTLESLAT